MLWIWRSDPTHIKKIEKKKTIEINPAYSEDIKRIKITEWSPLYESELMLYESELMAQVNPIQNL